MSLHDHAKSLATIFKEAQEQAKRHQEEIDRQLSKLYEGKAKNLATATTAELHEDFQEQSRKKQREARQKKVREGFDEVLVKGRVTPEDARFMRDMNKNNDSEKKSEPKPCLRTQRVAANEARLKALLTNEPALTKSETSSVSETSLIPPGTAVLTSEPLISHPSKNVVIRNLK